VKEESNSRGERRLREQEVTREVPRFRHWSEGRRMREGKGGVEGSRKCRETGSHTLTASAYRVFVVMHDCAIG